MFKKKKVVKKLAPSTRVEKMEMANPKKESAMLAMLKNQKKLVK